MTGSDSLYELADFRLDPRRRLLTRRSGEQVELPAKALEALIYLVARAGTLVPRAELTKALWPTTIVEDNSLTQAISTLRRALGDEQGGQRLIVTVSGRGYQFVGAVRALPASQAGPLDTPRPPLRVHGARSLHVAIGGAVALVVAAAAMLAPMYLGDTQDVPSTAQTAVAVLPFRDLSQTADDAFFAAALHEEVLSRLARIRGLTVMGRTSVMGYADGTRSLTEIASELGVGAVLEGSASRMEDRVRVSVRLVAADTGAVLWTETYDGYLDDVFGIQADIAAKIAAAFEAPLSPAERTSLAERPTRSLEAYALYLRAIALYRAAGGIGPAMPAALREQMQSYFDRAVAIDESFAAAYAWKAYIYVDSLFFDAVPEQEWPSRRAAYIEAVEGNAGRALRLDAASAVAHVARARLEMFRARFDDSRAALERAQAANPNDSQALQQTALLHSLQGDFPRAIAAARRALRVDPKNPGSYAPLVTALQLSGQHADAVATAEAMIQAAPGAAIAYVLLARAEIARGNVPAALEALRLAERLAEPSPAVALDFAVGYRRLGRSEDAERWADEFAATAQGLYVGPALQAAERQARGDDEGALHAVRDALTSRTLGADPLGLATFQWNVWSHPVLEEPQWRALRGAIADLVAGRR